MKQLSQEQISALPEWLPIEGFPNYEVNCREGIVRNSRTLKVLKPCLDTHGYPYIRLRKDGKVHTKNVHRIVALTAFGFYNIPTDGLFACHLDEERHNPCIDNLALATNKENLNFPKAKQRNAEAKRNMSLEARKKLSDAQPKKPVVAYKNGKPVMIFQSTCEAGRNGFNQGTISACCTGRRRAHKGYQWRYLDSTTAMTV